MSPAPKKRNVGRSVWREAGEERKKSVLVVRLFVIIELQCGNFHQFGFQLLILHGNELFQLFAGFIRRGHDLHHVAVHAVCAGRAQMGILQIDAIYARSLEGCQMKAVASYGTEFALLIFPPRSGFDELSDLGPGSAVLVDGIGSGSDLFWRTIVRIETGEDGDSDQWAQTRAVNDPVELANASAEMGEIHAVLLVRKSDAADVQALLGQGWTLGELWDRDIDDLAFNGGPLYLSEKQKIMLPGGKTSWAWTYGVRSFVAVTQKVAAGDRQLFAAITAAAQ